MMMQRPSISGVYAITPDCGDDDLLARRVEAALRGGVHVLQYRNKTVSGERRARQAKMLLDLSRRYGALFIVNDDAELARQVNADGVHLGRDDGSFDDARRRLGAGKIIGVSCYNELARARSAATRGADYVAFGSVFVSTIKPDAVRAPLALFEQAKREVSVPVVAIGGIKLANAPAIIAAGADAVAVISALFAQSSIEEAARALCGLFDHAHDLRANAGR